MRKAHNSKTPRDYERAAHPWAMTGRAHILVRKAVLGQEKPVE
jgi:hypothetical protein